YLVMHTWSSLFGDSPYALRLVSALLGVAVVPLIYWAGTRMFSRRAGLIAAGLAALSPVEIHYAQEARMYGMVPVLAVAVLYTFYRLLVAPARWAFSGFVGALAAGLYLHYYFLFLLPLAGFALWAPQPRAAVRRAAGALLLVAAMFAPWVPIFLGQAANSSPDWIGTFWRRHEIVYAVPWSLESLGPGARYPTWSTFKFASSAASGVISLCLAALVLGGAALQLYRSWQDAKDPRPSAPPSLPRRGKGGGRTRRAKTSPDPSLVDRETPSERPMALALTLAAVLVPLLIAFTVSLLRRPVYVVARYDLIAWGAYYLLAGAVLARLRPRLAWPLIALWVALSCYTLWPYFTTDRPKRNYADLGQSIARTLVAKAQPGESVVFTASTRTMTQYYLRRTPNRFRLMSYPLGTDAHLGWIDQRIRTNKTFAAREAQRFATWLVDSGTPPGVVWVVAPRSRGTAPLLAELRRRGYRPDRTRSRGVLLCLRRE
ncbi:MAG: glycosyltransferase family 39 protein, partial [Candidatus Binatia bacterium]